MSGSDQRALSCRPRRSALSRMRYSPPDRGIVGSRLWMKERGGFSRSKPEEKFVQQPFRALDLDEYALG